MPGTACRFIALAAAVALVLAWAAVAPGSARAATPQPGLWVGTKGDVRLSFTVRAQGSRRVVTDVTTFCGNYGSVEENDGRARSFKVSRRGRILGWADTGERPPVLRATRGVVDARSYLYSTRGPECPERDFQRIRVTRGDFRPIQDGTYHGESGAAYDFDFEVAGGGAIARDLSGHAGVPDGSSLTGYCGPGGAIGSTARIGADGSFAFDRGHDGRHLIVRGGFPSPTSVSGEYTYTAPERCVASGPLSGTVAWTASLTEAAPGSAPPGTAEPPPTIPTEPKPQPDEGYLDPPKPSKDPGCTAQVKAGPLDALAACFVTRGDVAVSKGRVRLNGIDLTPARPGSRIRINRRTFAVSSTGPVELRIGSLSLVRDRLDWQRPAAVFEIQGRSARRDPGPAFSTRGQRLFGLGIDGSAKLELEGGRTLLTVTVSVPEDGATPGLLRGLAGYSGELRAAADNASGLILDGAKLTFPGLRVGFVEIQSAQLAIARAGSTYHFDGSATIYPFRFNRIGFSGGLGFGLGDGYLRLAAAVEQLNRPLVYGVFLQRIGFELQVNPFGLGGSAGVTFGPQIHLGGDLVSIARLDGSLRYLSSDGGSPAVVELAGQLEIAEAKAADGKVTVRGDGSVDASGTFVLEVAGYGLEGGLSGWFDGTRAFNVEGKAHVSIPGPDGEGDVVLSSRGVGACRHGWGPDVGFGYTWGDGIGGLSFVANSCSVGSWREERGTARAAAAGEMTVRARRGLRQLAVQVRGTSGAPLVAVTAPDGRRIVPSSAPGGEVVDERTLLVQDPATGSTYLVVDRPRPGRWRIETLPGSPPVAGLRTAAPLPKVHLRGRVRGRRHGKRRVLRYRARRLAGRRLRLVDVARGSRKVIATTQRARGRVRFAPADRRGRHRIVAQVLTANGLPTGEQRRVDAFRVAVRRPSRPRRVRVRHRGSSLVVRWRGPRRLRYEVDARLSDGRRLRLIARPGRRWVRIGVVPRDVRARVVVRGRDRAGRPSRAARARG